MFNKSYGIYRIVCDADKFENYNDNAHIQLIEWMDEHIAKTNEIGTKVAKGYVFNEVRTFINRDTAEYGIFIDYNNTRDINNFEGAIQEFVAWAVENGHIVSFEPVFSTVVGYDVFFKFGLDYLEDLKTFYINKKINGMQRVS